MNSEKVCFGNKFPQHHTSRKAYRSNSLTIDEQFKFLSVVDNYEDMALFKLALNTGIRREDIVRIEIGNMDIEQRKLKFWESKKRRWWEVPLTQEVAMELLRYTNTLPKGQKRLFTFSGRTAYNKLQRYLKKVGIKKQISFHDLRRTFIKTAKRKGLSPKAVSQITGDTLRVVQEHYENLDMEELKEEVEKL
jgi:integrase